MSPWQNTLGRARERGRCSTLVVAILGLGVLLIACKKSDASFTDSTANRERALVLSRAYVEQHRPQLLPGGRGVVGKETINGGSLRNTSKRAFEVSLAISDAPRAKDVVVYVYDADGLVVAGAQSRDKYGAVMLTIGGHLDREFTSRD